LYKPSSEGQGPVAEIISIGLAEVVKVGGGRVDVTHGLTGWEQPETKKTHKTAAIRIKPAVLLTLRFL